MAACRISHAQGAPVRRFARGCLRDERTPPPADEVRRPSSVRECGRRRHDAAPARLRAAGIFHASGAAARDQATGPADPDPGGRAAGRARLLAHDPQKARALLASSTPEIGLLPLRAEKPMLREVLIVSRTTLRSSAGGSRAITSTSLSGRPERDFVRVPALLRRRAERARPGVEHSRRASITTAWTTAKGEPGIGQAPILVSDGKFDSGTVVPRFQSEAVESRPTCAILSSKMRETPDRAAPAEAGPQARAARALQQRRLKGFSKN